MTAFRASCELLTPPSIAAGAAGVGCTTAGEAGGADTGLEPVTSSVSPRPSWDEASSSATSTQTPCPRPRRCVGCQTGPVQEAFGAGLDVGAIEGHRLPPQLRECTAATCTFRRMRQHGRRLATSVHIGDLV